MEFDYDVLIIGGAFSGAATGVIIKRNHPGARVLIIEKNAAFDRKVGESTTEVSSRYMTRILGLANYLGHEQLAKQGLRMWFCNSPEQRFDDCVEIARVIRRACKLFKSTARNLIRICCNPPSMPAASYCDQRRSRRLS